MSSYQGKSSYGGDPGYPDDHPQGYSKTQDYLKLPGPPNAAGYHGGRNNPYSSSSRMDPDYPGSVAEPDYPGTLNHPNYPGGRSNPFSADPDYHDRLPEPDYEDLPGGLHLAGSSGDPNYSDSQLYSGLAGPRGSHSYAGPRTNPGYLGSWEEPDYPEVRNHHDRPDFGTDSRIGSRRESYAGSRISPYAGALGEPDYPPGKNQPHSPRLHGKPDYPGAEDSQNSPSFWGEPDYPGAEDDPDYGSPKTLTTRGHNSSGLLGRENEFSESIEMTPMETMGSRGYSPLGSPENGYVNPAYVRESSYVDGSLLLSESDWHTSPQAIPVKSKTPERQEMPLDDHADDITIEVEGIPSGVHSLLSSHERKSPMKPTISLVLAASDVDVADCQLMNPSSDRIHNCLLRFTSRHESVSQTHHSPECLGVNALCTCHETSQGQKLIASLVPMTSRDRIKSIRNQPRTMGEKRILRKIVDKEKSKQSPRGLEVQCCTQCLNSLSLAYRRSKNSVSEVLSSVSLWQKTLKVIGGKFGTSVLSYFNFLLWLLKFNIFTFVVNFSFIIIPQFTVAERNTLQFTGLEFFTGAGYFSDTVMYYGFYTNSTIGQGTGRATYNMQLAYIFTIGACLVTCFFSLLFSMAKYFRNNFINPHIYSRGIAKLVFCWDFTVTHDKAVWLKQKNLSTEIRENLSEIRQENTKFTLRQQLTRFSTHVAAWLVSTGVAAACCTGVYYLADYNSEFLRTHSNPGAVLLLPFVVSCINLVVPRFYSMFRLVEKFEMPRHEIYVVLIRNIFLKISIVGILCYYWLNSVALSGDECWETLIGQDIYRLLLMDFVFSLADSLLGELLKRLIGMKFTSLGLQEFDIARNVLELIYVQTLAWLGIFFCPLLPFIQMVTLFIMFYVKNISLMVNSQPPSKAWRASQMITLFIFLLFFPSFTGVLCTLAITIWRLKPSANCGPFRGLPSFIQSIYSWIDTLSKRSGYLWVVWIYQNLIGSVHFFFILTLIVLIITYLYWQITEGRKIMIRLLHEQIINEGKDKMFLIEKLTKLQDMEKRANPNTVILERREVEQQSPLYFGEHDAASDLRFRQSLQEENPKI